MASCLMLLPSYGTAQSSNELPTTAQFQALLTTCAAGSRTEIDGVLTGSFTSVYEGATTEATGFRFLTVTDFLNSLPSEHKLEGLKLYYDCVESLLRGEPTNEENIPEIVELPSELVTFGQPLVIKAVTLVARNTEIRAFPSGTLATAGSTGTNSANGANGANGSGGAGADGRPGNAGGQGSDGQSAGQITIEAETLVGDLRIFNNGVGGGNGGPGGAGGSGGAGGQGSSSVSGLFDCSSGPGNGGPGGSAGAGGDGGRGGNGGSGGTVTVRLETATEGSTIAITSIGGVLGQPGNPGQAGTPGRGGPRGNTGGNCGGGGRVAGPNGAPANSGRNLGPGQTGIDGQIEVIVGTQTFIGTREFSQAF